MVRRQAGRPGRGGRTAPGVAVVLVLGVVVLAAACGDPQPEAGSGVSPSTVRESTGSSTTAAPARTPDPTTTTAPAVGAVGVSFCQQAEEFNRVLGTVDASRIESFDLISEQVTALALVAPPDLTEDLAVMRGYWERLAAVDATDASEVSSLVQRDPAAEAAGQRVVGYLVDECGIVPVG